MTTRSRHASAIAVALLSLFAAHPLLAWNAAGHRAITFLAYNYLTPQTRQRVDAILRAHPDYASVLTRNPIGDASSDAPLDPVDLARNAFTMASVWPDIIKGDPRFTDAPIAGQSVQPGFPDMLRHQNWHYINTPFPEEFRSEPIVPANALNEIKRLLKTLRKDGPVTPEEVYALPWILHIISDVHQPLHTIARFRRMPDGSAQQDLGGNACFVTEDRNLHSLWDSVLGVNANDYAVARLSASISDRLPAPRKVDTRPSTWIREGVELAGSVVYEFTGDCTNRDQPLAVTPAYRKRARSVAMERAALGAYRIAAILNDLLGND
ncbi:MAG: S1/P1 nuclease [Bryobacteraceae bacterium]|nr:S1/P1 nuclease [Bryobacteraceae bacterium]